MFLLSMFFLAIFSFVVYPFILMLIPKRFSFSKESHKPKKDHTYSIIVAAHNAEKEIESKIQNLLQIKHFNGHKDIQIIIVSDASTDQTADIVNAHRHEGIEFYEYPDRQGKEYAQLEGLKKAKGEIIIFTDVAAMPLPECVEIIDSVFAHDEVGAVSSVDQYTEGKKPGLLTFENLYIKYEMWLRSLETERAGLIGMSGSFMAVRKEVCEGMGLDTCSDFWLAMNATKLGYRCVQADNLYCRYAPVPNEKSNIERRARTVSKGILGFWKNKHMLNPFENTLYAFQLFSHKLMRWVAVPSAALFSMTVFVTMPVVFQIYAILGVAIAYLLIKPFRKLVNFAYSVMISFLIAFWRISVARMPRYWDPSERV